MSDSIRIELNCGTPSWCRTFSCCCEGKTSTYLVTRCVRSEVFCVTSKEESLGRQTREGGTGFFSTEEGKKLSFPTKEHCKRTRILCFNTGSAHPVRSELFLH